MRLDAHAVAGWPPDLTWMIGGAEAFERLFARIDAAQHTIEVRAYIWRDDPTGQALARALLDAADRGVAVRILKSADAATHEWHEAGGQSFFHKRLMLRGHVTATALHGFYAHRPRVARQRPSALADALRAHPGVHLEIAERHDHAKVFVIDDALLLLGGMCIGQDAHHDLLDHMVELSGAAAVARYRARVAGEAAYDPARPWDFLVNPGAAADDLRAQRVARIDGAQESVRVEMSFFGDPAFTDALCRAVDRGVATTILAPRKAGKLRWYNPQVFNALRRRTGAPPHLRIALYPGGVHAKLLVVDAAWVDVGSANFTLLSHEGYGEANVGFQSAVIGQAIAAAMDAHVAQAQVARKRLRASRVRARLERHFMERAGKQALRH